MTAGKSHLPATCAGSVAGGIVRSSALDSAADSSANTPRVEQENRGRVNAAIKTRRGSRGESAAGQGWKIRNRTMKPFRVPALDAQQDTRHIEIHIKIVAMADNGTAPTATRP
jgi:hypothetical protein